MMPMEYLTSDASSLNDFIHWRWNCKFRALLSKWVLRLQYKTEAPIFLFFFLLFFLFLFLPFFFCLFPNYNYLKADNTKKGSRYEGRSLGLEVSLSLSLISTFNLLVGSISFCLKCWNWLTCPLQWKTKKVSTHRRKTCRYPIFFLIFNVSTDLSLTRK